jgi:hypothetical protein
MWQSFPYLNNNKHLKRSFRSSGVDVGVSWVVGLSLHPIAPTHTHIFTSGVIQVIRFLEYAWNDEFLIELF